VRWRRCGSGPVRPVGGQIGLDKWDWGVGWGGMSQAERMELRIMTEPQAGAVYDDLLAVARRAEETGFGAFFRSDHLMSLDPSREGLPGSTDAWTTLAGLARETSRIRLGTLVSSATFRRPGILAIQVAQVDQMSGGRVEMGLGAGWYEAEHDAYGIPFPVTGERFDQLSEQLEIVTGLWSTPVGERFDFTGKHYTLTKSPALPKPVQAAVPVIVGGVGLRRTPALAAQYAHEFNVPFLNVPQARSRFDAVKAACRAIGREDEPVNSVMLSVGVGRTQAEIDRRTAVFEDKEALAARGVIGSPEQAVDALGRYAEAGCERMYLQLLNLTDLDQLDLIGSEVIPHV
jgi:F420-dependent oxidoreductase-like protein